MRSAFSCSTTTTPASGGLIAARTAPQRNVHGVEVTSIVLYTHDSINQEFTFEKANQAGLVVQVIESQRAA
ncbi:MAG: hypothetical protein WBE30_15935, partial [Candidatus Cybelea sp.]